MSRFGPLSLIVAAAAFGLTAHADPAVSVGAAARPIGAGVVTVGNEVLSLGNVPGLPTVSSRAAAASNDDASPDQEDAAEPSVLTMILASLGMIAFIVARRQSL